MSSKLKIGFNARKAIYLVSVFLMSQPVISNDTGDVFTLYNDMAHSGEQKTDLPSQLPLISSKSLEPVPPESLGPVIGGYTQEALSDKPLTGKGPWAPIIIPFLENLSDAEINVSHEESEKFIETKPATNTYKESVVISKKQVVDDHPKRARIAILIDDLGYSRRGMVSSLALPVEVALAILPETPFAQQTALAAQKQKRLILLHAPMENERELELGPGGLYAKMTESELKATLESSLASLPGVQGVNNHMGSLLTTKPDAMKWVMEILNNRSLFFIDSLTSAKSVAEQAAKEQGLRTVSRDVFLDNIRMEKAIDKQFTRLLKLARRKGSVLAIGHPYPETMAYLKNRLKTLGNEGIQLVPLSAILLPHSMESNL